MATTSKWLLLNFTSQLYVKTKPLNRSMTCFAICIQMNSEFSPEVANSWNAILATFGITTLPMALSLSLSKELCSSASQFRRTGLVVGCQVLRGIILRSEIGKNLASWPAKKLKPSLVARKNVRSRQTSATPWGFALMVTLKVFSLKKHNEFGTGAPTI